MKMPLLVSGIFLSAHRPQPSFGSRLLCNRKATITCRSIASSDEQQLHCLTSEG